jgi:hypothetical protein
VLMSEISSDFRNRTFSLELMEVYTNENENIEVAGITNRTAICLASLGSD